MESTLTERIIFLLISISIILILIFLKRYRNNEFNSYNDFRIIFAFVGAIILLIMDAVLFIYDLIK